jgi:hypothetical protein
MTKRERIEDDQFVLRAPYEAGVETCQSVVEVDAHHVASYF